MLYSFKIYVDLTIIFMINVKWLEKCVLIFSELSLFQDEGFTAIICICWLVYVKMTLKRDFVPTLSGNYSINYMISVCHEFVC